MTKMSPVLRIKAELFLSAASKKLLAPYGEAGSQPVTRPHVDTVKVIRKELEKLVEILADDASEKHFNVAARVAKCADYLAQIPASEVTDARYFMVAAHKVLQDVEEITL
jgi:phosphopantetheine adenylyltransferase